MPIVAPLKKLDIDGVPHLVEDMSPQVQQLVAVYNEWNQDFADAKSKAGQLQAAVAAAHANLSDQIQTEFKEAQARQAAEQPVIAPPLDAEAEAIALVAEEEARALATATAARELEDVAVGDRFGLGQEENI